VANDDARGTVAESEESPQLDIWALDPDVATLIAEVDAIGFLSDDNPGRRKQPVVTIAARVFDHRRRVALMLAVHPLSPLSTPQIQVIGKKLTEETVAISEAQQHPAVEDLEEHSGYRGA
jgi:hypothetical protein